MLPIYVGISRVAKEWKIKGLDSQRNNEWILLFNIPRFQSWSSSIPIPNPMPRLREHILTQRISYALNAVLPRRLPHQPQSKFLSWRKMMTELSRWMWNFILSRRSYRKKFILGSYLRFLAFTQGEKDGVSLNMVENNNNWRDNRNNHITLKDSSTKADTK